MSSLKPYLIRAVYDWCVDQDLTPYLLVNAEASDLIVPRQFVQDGRIVLNLRPQAVHNLALGDVKIEFNARFGGVPMHVKVPIGAVLAIYARENGQGMVFDESEPSPPPSPSTDEEAETKLPRPRPVLKVVK